MKDQLMRLFGESWRISLVPRDLNSRRDAEAGTDRIRNSANEVGRITIEASTEASALSECGSFAHQNQQCRPLCQI